MKTHLHRPPRPRRPLLLAVAAAGLLAPPLAMAQEAAPQAAVAPAPNQEPASAIPAPVAPAASVAAPSASVSPSAPVASSTHAEPASPFATDKPIEITCTGESSFDSAGNVAVFVKDVQVRSAEFSLLADKLTLYLKKEEKPPKPAPKTGEEKPGDGGAAGTPASPATSAPTESTSTPAESATSVLAPATPAPSVAPAASGAAAAATSAPADAGKEAGKGVEDSAAGRLERVIAEGNVTITLERVDPQTNKPTRSTGKAARVEYAAATGEAVLTGWPRLQQGDNVLAATTEGTVIILNRAGKLRNIGPCTMLFNPADKGDLKLDGKGDEKSGQQPGDKTPPQASPQTKAKPAQSTKPAASKTTPKPAAKPKPAQP